MSLQRDALLAGGASTLLAGLLLEGLNLGLARMAQARSGASLAQSAWALERCNGVVPEERGLPLGRMSAPTRRRTYGLIDGQAIVGYPASPDLASILIGR